MSTSPRVPLVAVKLTPVGRVQTFLSGEDPQALPRVGDRVVVQTEGGPAVGTVVRGIPQLDAKRRPASDSPQRVVRVATKEDIVARLKHQHREQEAYRILQRTSQDRSVPMVEIARAVLASEPGLAENTKEG